jgi:hypothetical protein
VIFNRIFLEREVFLKKLAGIKKLDHRVLFSPLINHERKKKSCNHRTIAGWKN